MFRNPGTTEFVIVTIPTAMAAAESIRLAKALQKEQASVIIVLQSRDVRVMGCVPLSEALQTEQARAVNMPGCARWMLLDAAAAAWLPCRSPLAPALDLFVAGAHPHARSQPGAATRPARQVPAGV